MPRVLRATNSSPTPARKPLDLKEDREIEADRRVWLACEGGGSSIIKFSASESGTWAS